MRKSIVSLAVVGSAVVLSACAPGLRSYRPFVYATPSNEASVNVDVSDDQYIVVSAEPIYIKQSDDNAIYWSLPPGGPWWFPNSGQDQGIAFQPPAPVQTNCGWYNGNKYTFVCTYKKSNKKKYTYIITVTNGSSPPIHSDPTVMNN